MSENNNNTEDLGTFQKKQDKDEPFVHRFFWICVVDGKHDYPDLLEINALKLANQAHCHFVKVDEVKEGKDYSYYIVAQGKKQKLMLLMELSKAWFLGMKFVYEKRRRILRNK